LEEVVQRVSWATASTGSMEEYEKRAEVAFLVGFYYKTRRDHYGYLLLPLRRHYRMD
jgi:hypothetical protein